MNLEHFGAQLRSCFCILFSPKQAAEHIKRTTKTGASRSASAALSGNEKRTRIKQRKQRSIALRRLRKRRMESLFFVYFSASQDSRTHKAHEKNKGIEMSIASSKRPSARARSARASAQGAPAKSCRLVAMCALASLAWVAAFSSFALLQEPFARGSPEGSKSFPRAPDLQ